MNDLVALFHRLSNAQPGTEEHISYGLTLGTTAQERAGIVPAPPHVTRILSQVAFAIELSAASNHAYDATVEAALRDLLRAQEANGAITKAAADAAERALLPLSDAAKAYTVLCAAHAHIDMNWMWSYHETVACTLDTFRTMLDLMDEYPAFTFSQSQASVYAIVEQFDPDMMQRIKARIAEGRWEVTASTWVENDKNMPTAESLARHNLYTKRYMHRVWGVPEDALNIDFSPDTFGHSRNLPEIASHAGIKYYYHCRALDGDELLYRWRAPSGAELLVYREPFWYNSYISPQVGIGMFDVCARTGLTTALAVYGVGDHGGGPTRRDLNRILEMNAWPVFPNIAFGTFAQFYAIAETVRESLPIVDHELNPFAMGCYSTQSRIKLGNRKAEALLYDSEALAALSKSTYRRDRFEHAWRNVLFTHFHDILTGSCVQDTREHAMGLYQEAFAIANTARADAMRAVAADIDTSAYAETGDVAGSQSQGAGVGFHIGSFAPPSPESGNGLTRVYHVFNPSAHERRDLVEITLWDWPGDARRAHIVDGDGNDCRLQWLDKEKQWYWEHRFMRLLAEVTVPAMGYATLVLREDAPTSLYTQMYRLDERASRAYDEIIEMGNDLIAVRISAQTGRVLDITDRNSGESALLMEAGFDLKEEDVRTADAWQIGRIVNHDELYENLCVTTIDVGEGKLRQSVTVEGTIRGDSTIKYTMSLDAGSRALAYDIEVDWHEIGRKNGLVPQLAFSVPLNFTPETYRYDIPAGTIERPEAAMDAPGNTYVAAGNGEGLSVQLMTDCKYGFRAADDALSVTLIHAATRPDPYPERGIHKIRLAIALTPDCTVEQQRASFAFYHPLAYLSTKPHAGTRPASGSLLALEGKVAISGIKATEDGGGTLVRLYDLVGQCSVATLAVPGMTQAWMADTMENRGQALRVEAGRVQVPIAAHGVAAVILA